MIVGRGRFDARGWYVALVALWLLTGLPLVLFIGIGFAGLGGFAIWMALNVVLLAPFLFIPYGLRRIPSGGDQ